MNNQHKTGPINIPNILTLIRILLTPPFVILLLRGRFSYALLLFTIAGISDGLDGFLARYFNQRTMLGAYLDPVADKALLISAFACLAIQGAIPDWVAVLVISRDIIIVIGIAILTLNNIEYKINPILSSKCTTMLQIITVFITLIGERMVGFRTIHPVLLWATSGLTVLSGIQYLYLGMNILHNTSEQGRN